MRPVSVTRPAPMITPNIPTRGRVEIADGIAAAVARAISAGVGGRVVIAGDAIMVRLSSRADGGKCRKARLEFGGQVGIIQRDLYRNALHDLSEVAGSIVRRQQRKLRSAGRSNVDNLAVNGYRHCSGQRI